MSVSPGGPNAARGAGLRGLRSLGLGTPALALTLITTLLVTSCGGDGKSEAPAAPAMSERTLLVNGSSTLYPVTQEAARRFRRSHRDADIRVTFAGTSEGLRQFCSGTLHIANASRAINPEEEAACTSAGIAYEEFMVATDTLAIVTHFENDWVDYLSVEELDRVWNESADGRVTHWNQIRPEWPERPLTLYGRGRDSGTYDYFTQAITGELRSSRRDYSASEDEEWLAEAIAADSNSLGFFGIGAYHRHWESLRVIAIDSGEGAVYPSVETAASRRYTPLSRPLYLYVSKRSLAQKPDLAPFLDSYFAGARRWLHLTGYLPLDAEVYTSNRERLQQY